MKLPVFTEPVSSSHSSQEPALGVFQAEYKHKDKTLERQPAYGNVEAAYQYLCSNNIRNWVQ